MEDFATATGDVIYGLGIVAKRIKELTTIPGVGSLFDVKNIPVIGAYLSGFQQIGKNARETNNSQFNTVARPSSAEIAIQLKLLKGKKDELATLQKKNAIENKNVEELKKKFDLERIGINAALNNATDEETKLRLKAQLAILDNNEALAKKLLAEMNGVKAVDELATAMNNAAKSILTAGQMVLFGLGVDPSRIGAGGVMTSGTGFAASPIFPRSNPNFASSATGMDLGLALGFTPGSRSNAAPQEIVVTVNTANAGDRLSQAIAETIQIATKNGYSTVPAGQGF
jgi:hypothetical protein